MRNFKSGDTVILKSGGPKMTVQNYHSPEKSELRLTCTWFDKNELKAGTFYEDQLELQK